MLDLIKRNRPLLLPVIIGITSLLWLERFINPSISVSIFEQYPMPLYNLVLKIPVHTPFLLTSTALLLLLIQGFTLNQLNARFRLIEEGTYLPGFIYLLTVSSIQETLQINPLLLANFCLLFSFYIFFPTFRIDKFIDPFFKGAFLISLGSLFYFPLIFMSLALFYFLISTRSFYWREWVVAVIGLITPYLIAFSVYYVLDSTNLIIEAKDHQLFSPVNI